MAMKPYVAGSSSLVLGADSYTVPTDLDDREYVFSQNCVCRGGILQTRPGTRTLFCLPDGNFQGQTLFTPDNGVAQLVAAVDGKIYVSAAPFTSYRRLTNLQFSPTAKYMAWAVGLKSTDYDLDGNLVSLADPYSVLIMQDGLTRAAYWDGGISAHLNPASPSDVTDSTDISDGAPGYNETPVGLWMIWSGNRLWVSRGNQIFASDIGNPLKFTEALYLNEARAFSLSGPCTGFIATPDQKGIIAFTENDGTFFQSNIQDRTLWLTTPDFQSLILPNIGCVAPRSLVTQYGLNWWFGPRGFTNLNSAFRQNLSSRIDYQDNQMFASKAYLGPDLSNICASFYENYLMVSVPSGDVLNRHTWVLDQAPLDGNVNAWTGIWTGWRPIEWARGLVNGNERVFFGSVDYDGKNRIWEAMQPERKDNGCRITCYAQLRDHAAGDLEDKRYEWSKFFLSQILGEVDLNVYVASTKGAYQFQKNYHIVATEGQIFADVEYSEAGPLMVGNRVQSRTIRTPADPTDNECNACGVESKEGNMIDYAFSHLLVWTGQMGIRAYQMYMRESPDRNTGDCEESEVGPRTLNAQGCSGLELLVDGQVFTQYTAHAEGTTITRQGLDVYIRRTAVSYISQESAQTDANCALEQTIAQLKDSDVPVGVYESGEAEIGSGSYVVVKYVADATDDPPPPPDEVSADVLIVGGGGGGGFHYGGGGGGGDVIALTAQILSTVASYPAVVGAGGTNGVTGSRVGGVGSTSSFNGSSAVGGGGGGGSDGFTPTSGASGGAGSAYTAGGGSGMAGAAGTAGGTGGSGQSTLVRAAGGGGGGDGGNGANGNIATTGGDGGLGASSSISGASVTYGGGGGGGSSNLTSGAGVGNGGGGNGGYDTGLGSSAAANRGGGGGGGGNLKAGGSGGSGVVIVRYAGDARFTGGTITSDAGDTIHTFTSSGTLTPI